MKHLVALLSVGLACNQLHADSAYPMAEGKQDNRKCDTIGACETPEQREADEALLKKVLEKMDKEVADHGGKTGWQEWKNQQEADESAKRRAIEEAEKVANVNRAFPHMLLVSLVGAHSSVRASRKKAKPGARPGSVP